VEDPCRSAGSGPGSKTTGKKKKTSNKVSFGGYGAAPDLLGPKKKRCLKSFPDEQIQRLELHLNLAETKRAIVARKKKCLNSISKSSRRSGKKKTRRNRAKKKKLKKPRKSLESNQKRTKTVKIRGSRERIWGNVALRQGGARGRKTEAYLRRGTRTASAYGTKGYRGRKNHVQANGGLPPVVCAKTERKAGFRGEKIRENCARSSGDRQPKRKGCRFGTEREWALGYHVGGPLRVEGDSSGKKTVKENPTRTLLNRNQERDDEPSKRGDASEKRG